VFSLHLQTCDGPAFHRHENPSSHLSPLSCYLGSLKQNSNKKISKFEKFKPFVLLTYNILFHDLSSRVKNKYTKINLKNIYFMLSILQIDLYIYVYDDCSFSILH